MFSFKPNYQQTRDRIEAFWKREVLDRPLTMFTIARPLEEQIALPPSHHVSPSERWLDAAYQAESALARLSNIDFTIGDALPIAYPNLGPEIFSAFYGCPVHFSDWGTSWTDPILDDWADADQLTLDWNHPYLLRLDEMTDALLEMGRGKFITGMTDWHPGGDALAAFRDPQRLALDMIEHVDEVKALLPRVEADYFALYDIFYDKLRAAGQPISSWTTLVCDEKYYIPSNDFSGMVSRRMFEDVFLPGIIRECRFLDRSIYHVDGPGALRHLDTLLAIPELDAIQWVPGAGREEFARWIPVYQRVQAAGKAVQVLCKFSEIDTIIEALDPHGVLLSIGEVPSREAAEDMLRKLEKWAARRAH